MCYKAAAIQLIDPRNSSRTCPRCDGGMKPHKEWRVLSCGACGLVIDRQLNAAINLYLRMRGFSPPEGWEDVVLPVLGRSGVAPVGAKAGDVPPMNPEGDEADETQGAQLSPKPL